VARIARGRRTDKEAHVIAGSTGSNDIPWRVRGGLPEFGGFRGVFACDNRASATESVEPATEKILIAKLTASISHPRPRLPRATPETGSRSTLLCAR